MVLPADPEVEFHDDEPPDILRPADAMRGERWAAIYTHSRREKKVARTCRFNDIRHYLPLYEHDTGDARGRTYLLPLLPGYLFACIDHDSRLEILKSGGIVRMLWPTQEDVLLRELSQIRAALEASVDLVVGPAVKQGDLVRVIRGPLEGVEGMIRHRMRRRRRERLVLNVGMTSSGATAQIDRRDVEPVRRGRRLRHHSQVEEVSAECR